MKNYGFITFGHNNIYPDNATQPALSHDIDGIKIEVETDGGMWWITDVQIEGKSYNVHDTVNPSTLDNQSGNEKLNQLLEEGINLDEALEQCGAEWTVRIWDDTYAYIPEK